MLVGKFIFLIYLIGKVKKAIWSVSLGFFVQVRKKRNDICRTFDCFLYILTAFIYKFKKIIVFGNEPPVVAKPAGAPTSQPAARTNTGYPTQPSYPAQPSYPTQPPPYQSASNLSYPNYPQNVQGPPSGAYQPPTQTPYPAGLSKLNLKFYFKRDFRK